MFESAYFDLRIAIFCVSLIAAFFWKPPFARMALAGYLLVNAIEHGMPAHLDSASWWRSVNLPVRGVQFVAAVAVMAALYWNITKALDKWERIFLAMHSITLGLTAALIGAMWLPRDAFQRADASRQWGYFAMAVAWSASWLWLRWKRPLEMRRCVSGLADAWLLWMWMQFLISTTGKGNLLWNLVPWKGGAEWYYGVSDVSMIGHLGVALWMTAVSFRVRLPVLSGIWSAEADPGVLR